MTPGIFAKTFARPSVGEVFRAVAKHHLRAAHFNYACAGLPSLPEEIDPALADRVRKSAAEHRVAIVAVSGTFNMIHPEVTQRRDGLHKLEVIAGACEHLGTKLITLCTGTRDPENLWRHHPENDSPAAWRDLLVTMTKALTVADKHGVDLGIEPEVGNVVSSASHARRLLDEFKSPRLKIVLDPANLFRPGDLGRSEEIFDEAFDRLGADIAIAHAKELGTDGHAATLALGKGVLDWERYVSGLRAVKFNGPIIMHGFDEVHVAASLKFLRGVLDGKA